MKTAMQELYDFLIDAEQNNVFEVGTQNLKRYIETIYLPTEKQQIIEANINGTQDAFAIAFESLSGRQIVFTQQDLNDQKNEAEQYYTSTFETNKETLK